MPPIKRTGRPAAQPPRRRVAGRPTGQAGQAGDATTRPDEQAPEHTADVATRPAGRGSAGPADDQTPAGRTAERDTARSADRATARSADGATARSTADAGSGDAPVRSRRPAGRALAIGALVVGLAAGAGGVALLVTAPVADVENEAFVDREATEEVLTAASTNVQRLVAIDHESLDEYHASLGEFLTPNLVEQLDENWDTLSQTYEQSETKVDARVLQAGLTYLSGDRAEVLLVQDVSMTRGGAAAGSTTGTYLVGLDRIDGVWKLARIPDLPS